MWFKILESIWKSAPKDGESDTETREPSEDGTIIIQPSRPSIQREKPGDTECFEVHTRPSQEQPQEQEAQTTERPKTNRVAAAIREYGEIVIFGSAVLAILILGERNMFSSQIQYQQEPIVSRLHPF